MEFQDADICIKIYALKYINKTEKKKNSTNFLLAYSV